MFWAKKKRIDTDEQKINTLLSRGVDEVIDKEHLKKKLLSGKRLRVKLGIDPTSPNLHLGRSVPLLKMRDFQELGHQAIFIVGDFTGVIGDTSDKESERPMLDSTTVEKNKKTYFEQARKLINVSQAEMQYNSSWLKKLNYTDVGRHANVFSVADFIARDNIKRRLDGGTRVSLREILYPLMQGYDSVAVQADAEIGGVDQRFNLLAGRALQEEYNQEPQDIVMTTFPIEGVDGRKMSSSWGNTINFSDAPNDMFGKVMRVHDDLLERYLTLLTRMPLDEIQEILKQHPRDAKMHLAREIVRMYHGEEAARDAKKTFIATFSERTAPEDIPELSAVKGTILANALVAGGIVESKSEFRRLVGQGAIHIMNTGETIADESYVIHGPLILKVGKRRFVKIVAK
jgi:tyrosyl-tRNA synthetase